MQSRVGENLARNVRGIVVGLDVYVRCGGLSSIVESLVSKCYKIVKASRKERQKIRGLRI